MKIETWKKPAIILLFVSLSVLTRWMSLCVGILDLDEAGHIIGSWQLLEGKLLYTDFVDNKPPLVYVYYALAQILFGRGMFSVHLLTALVTVPATAWGVYAFFDRRSTGIYAALIFLFYSASFLAHDMLAANAEILMILPGIWALTLVNTWEKGMQVKRIAASSFLIGVGVLCKHQIVFWLPAVATAISIECLRRKLYAKWFAFGFTAVFSFLLPLTAAYAVFRYFGGAEAFFHWTVTNNISYAANPISLREAIGRAVSTLVPFVLVTSPLWFYGYRSSRLQESGYRSVLVLCLILFSVPAVFIGFRFFPHYFIQFYVPLSLAAAPYVSALFSEGKAHRFTVYSVSLFVLCNIVNAVLYFGDTNVYRERDPVYRKVAQVLKRSPCYTGATLFVWGYAPMFYYYAELTPASRFALLSHGGLTGYISGNLQIIRSQQNSDGRESWRLFLEDLDKNRCTYILDTAPAAIYRWDRYPMKDYPLLNDYVAKNFELITTVDQVAIYQRLHCH